MTHFLMLPALCLSLPSQPAQAKLLSIPDGVITAQALENHLNQVKNEGTQSAAPGNNRAENDQISLRKELWRSHPSGKPSSLEAELIRRLAQKAEFLKTGTASNLPGMARLENFQFFEPNLQQSAVVRERLTANSCYSESNRAHYQDGVMQAMSGQYHNGTTADEELIRSRFGCVDQWSLHNKNPSSANREGYNCCLVGFQITMDIVAAEIQSLAFSTERAKAEDGVVQACISEYQLGTQAGIEACNGPCQSGGRIDIAAEEVMTPGCVGLGYKFALKNCGDMQTGKKSSEHIDALNPNKPVSGVSTDPAPVASLEVKKEISEVGRVVLEVPGAADSGESALRPQ